MNRALSLAAVSCAAAGWVFAQQPRISNARNETRAVSGGLEQTYRSILSAQSSPAWLGYEVPIVAGDHQMCCWNDNVRGCWLEPKSEGRVIVVANNQPVKLEGPQSLVILFRVSNHQTDKIRVFTPECELDAGGLPFIWLTGVNPDQSIRMLLTMAKDTSAGSHEEMRKSDSAVTAIALHADPAADSALQELLAANQPDQVRRQAIFWLGNARGKRGYELVSKIVREDPNAKIREHAIFALTQSKEPGAIDVIVSVAHSDTNPSVRGQALFWLAQRASKKIAESAINDAIANDPETDVKKKAVFALTQMPSSEGVPLLIQVVRTNKNAEVRKQAMFWLGQSKDDRALKFIEDVLKQ